jgi:hypothetical protein
MSTGWRQQAEIVMACHFRAVALESPRNSGNHNEKASMLGQSLRALSPAHYRGRVPVASLDDEAADGGPSFHSEPGNLPRSQAGSLRRGKPCRGEELRVKCLELESFSHQHGKRHTSDATSRRRALESDLSMTITMSVTPVTRSSGATQELPSAGRPRATREPAHLAHRFPRETQ